MNRLLSILVTLFILFLVYLWINHLTGDSSGNKGPDSKETLALPEEDGSPDEIYSTRDTGMATPVQEPNEVVEEVNTPSTKKSDPAPPSNPVVKPEQPKSSDPKPKSAPKPPPSPAPVKSVTKSTEAASGLHLVIAGNFLEKANAEERVRQLQKLGYPLAEVVNFELSEYHTACAGRYSDLNEARRISKKIKEMHGIDTYVRLGN
jgi:outer membrane biosynthesis protein TonB